MSRYLTPRLKEKWREFRRKRNQRKFTYIRDLKTGKVIKFEGWL